MFVYYICYHMLLKSKKKKTICLIKYNYKPLEFYVRFIESYLYTYHIWVSRLWQFHQVTITLDHISVILDINKYQSQIHNTTWVINGSRSIKSLMFLTLCFVIKHVWRYTKLQYGRKTFVFGSDLNYYYCVVVNLFNCFSWRYLYAHKVKYIK